MTVVSLLNSGTDVQTKYEVYILFFSHLSSFVHHVTFFTLALTLSTPRVSSKLRRKLCTKY